jgi:hypothetical protein
MADELGWDIDFSGSRGQLSRGSGGGRGAVTLLRLSPRLYLLSGRGLGLTLGRGGRGRGPAALGLGNGPGSLAVEKAAGLRPWAS